MYLGKPNAGKARSWMLFATALATGFGTATSAYAQVDADQGGLADIVVTAQKREQSLQDVPIAITAITEDALQANRVTSVQDLSGLAPNMTVRPSAGGVSLPSFSMRGVISYGVVPGSDKQVSIYVDGVYIASPRGSAFEMPDIARIEVLRGPQGTLFGRNATAGAISIVTRDPDGVAGARQEFSFGNYDQFRVRTTVNTPQVGPFSAYATFVHDKRRGDVKNLGAGTYWDRTGPSTDAGAQVSADYLGNKNVDSFFGALKFEPSDTFSMVYKYDYAANDFTPEGTEIVALNPNAPLMGSLLTSLLNSQPVPRTINTSGDRPGAVNNSFVVEGRQRNSGHSLTANLWLSEGLSLKNVAAYRKSFINSTAQIDGLGGLIFTQQALVPYATFAAFSSNPALAQAPAAVQQAAIQATATALAPLVGSRFCVYCNNSQSFGEQWSNELQLNYDSDALTLTVGALYFHQKDRAGGPAGMANNFAFTTLPASGRLPLGNEATSYNKGTSIAAYAQGEFHLTPELDIVGGVRVTHDKKSGRFVGRGQYVPGPNGFLDGTFINQNVLPFEYKKTKPNFSVGVNYKPNTDILLFGKYSTAFVSGGSIGGLAFEPETVKAWEAGIKADLFDRRVRTNLALFHAKYNHLQSSQSGSNVGYPEISTVIVDHGDVTAKGFEFEATVLPLPGLTLTGSLGYTHIEYGYVNPIIPAGLNQTGVLPTGIPPWTAQLSGQYETPPLFGDATLTLRADATWHSDRRNNSNPNPDLSLPGWSEFQFTEASWTINSRAALRGLKLGAMDAEVAVWGKNLGNNKEYLFPLSFAGAFVTANYVQARTYGVDLIFKF